METVEPKKQRYSVGCWQCDGEGYIGCDDDWDYSLQRCDICDGKGFYIVTELTEDNCDRAIPIND